MLRHLRRAHFLPRGRRHLVLNFLSLADLVEAILGAAWEAAARDAVGLTPGQPLADGALNTLITSSLQRSANQPWTARATQRVKKPGPVVKIVSMSSLPPALLPLASLLRRKPMEAKSVARNPPGASEP